MIRALGIWKTGRLLLRMGTGLLLRRLVLCLLRLMAFYLCLWECARFRSGSGRLCQPKQIGTGFGYLRLRQLKQMGTGFGYLRLRQPKQIGTVLLVSHGETKRTVPLFPLGADGLGLRNNEDDRAK